MPSGWRAVKFRMTPDDDVGRVLAERALDRHEAAVAVEVVLDELAGRELARRPRRAPGASIRTSS